MKRVKSVKIALCIVDIGTEKPRSTPALDQVNEEIDKLNKHLFNLRESKSDGFSKVDNSDIEDVKKKINEKEVRKRRLLRDARAKVEKRKLIKDNIRELCETDEKAAKILKTVNRKVEGRPRLEVDQPGILSAIVDIVHGTSAADNRRRTPMLRTITTCSDLTLELMKWNYHLSRSAVYLRLIPRRGNTIEGLRHVQTGTT